MTDRLVVRSVNVRSAVRMGFALSLCAWGILLVGVVALYLLGLVSGGLGGIEGFIASVGFTGFRLSVLPFLAALILVAVVGSAAVAIVCGVVAFLYNGLRPIVGGVEVRTDAGGTGSAAVGPQEAHPAPPPPSPPSVPSNIFPPSQQPPVTPQSSPSSEEPPVRRRPPEA